jgi:hypothetical protein
MTGLYVHEDDWGKISFDAREPVSYTLDDVRRAVGPCDLGDLSSGYGARTGTVTRGFALHLSDEPHWNCLYGTTTEAGIVRELYLTHGEPEIADALTRLGAALPLNLVHNAWDEVVDLRDRAALERFLAGDS